MKFGSVCSGIEAASVAWGPLGWKAAWLSEIEPFPSAVLAHHYPDVPNLGDMTLLPERILSGEVEAPDVFCGGTPCQAFSVAGLRNSLDDARGNLSLVFCEIANAIDKVRSVRGLDQSIVFWENVPGVLSTKDNAFGCFLAGLAGEDNPLEPPRGKWTNAGYVLGPKRAVAWRVLDAQYFGVAQRRKRVFVVASAREDFDPVAVLFEFDGVRRDTAPSREARQGIAGGIEIGPSGGRLTDLNPTLDTRAKDGPIRNQLAGAVMQPVTAHRMVAFGENSDDGTASAMKARDYKDATDLVAQPFALQDVTPREKAQNGKGWNDDGTAYTVDTHATQGVVQPIPLDMRNAGRDPEKHDEMNRQGVGVGEPGDPAHTVTSAFVHGVANGMAVRRLTPVECERLQGFPDGYTNIPWRKKDESPDGPRYKALGNSWAVPVVAWIGERIAKSA
jgi:DNA (cytosine-5)-methyltransferase 1